MSFKNIFTNSPTRPFTLHEPVCQETQPSLCQALSYTSASYISPGPDVDFDCHCSGHLDCWEITD